MMLTDREETPGIAFKCFFIEGICYPVLQCASQHEGLPWSYLNIPLVGHLAIGDGLHAGRQSYHAESFAYIKNKCNSYDLQNSRVPKIQTHHVLL